MDEQVPHFDSVERQVRLPEPLGGDRRAHIRYPICMDLWYTVQDRRRPPASGNGHVVDLSSSGLRFTTDRRLEPRKKVELAISWPRSLDGGVHCNWLCVERSSGPRKKKLRCTLSDMSLEHEEQD